MNGEYVKKEIVLTLSEGWNDRQLSYFRKMVQQGGNLKINGDLFEITINEGILNSKGEKDGGIIVIPGIDERF